MPDATLPPPQAKQPGKWTALERLTRVRLYGLELGRWVMQTGTPNEVDLGPHPGVWTQLFSCLAEAPSVVNAAWEAVYLTRNQALVRDVLHQWQYTALNVQDTLNSEQLALFAARAYLAAIAGATVAGTYGRTYGQGFGLNLGGEAGVSASASQRSGGRTSSGEAVQHIGGVSSGTQGTNRAEACGASVSLVVSVMFVPLLQLLDLCLEYASPLEVPAISEAVELAITGWISRDHAKELVRWSGGAWEEWGPLIDARSAPLSPEQAIEYARRNGKDEAWQRQELQRAGVARVDVQDALLALYDEIPPVTDLLRFAQRNVTVDAVVQRFGLKDEFDRFWQGQLKAGLLAQGISEEWADLYWRAHWVTASVSTGQDALRRLRPGRVPKELEFTRDDLENLFRENDVLPFWRARMVALAYQPLTIRFLRELYRYHLLGSADLVERLQDIGYKAEDARIMEQSMTTQRIRSDVRDTGGLTPTELRRHYLADEITEAQYRQELAFQQFTPTQIDGAIRAADLRRDATNRKEYIASLKSAYVAYDYTSDQVRDRLIKIGVGVDRANQLLTVWSNYRHRAHKHETAAQVTTAFGRGLINAVQYHDALINLGYEEDSATLIAAIEIAKLKADQAKKQLAAFTAAQKAAAKRAADLAAAQRKAAAAAKRRNQIIAAADQAEADARLIEELAASAAQKEKDLAAAQTPEEKVAAKVGAIEQAGRGRAAAKRAAGSRKEAVDLQPPL